MMKIDVSQVEVFSNVQDLNEWLLKNWDKPIKGITFAFDPNTISKQYLVHFKREAEVKPK